MARRKMRHKRIVFDMCDNHFGTEYKDFHEEMIKIADLVTCPTGMMMNVIMDEVGIVAQVIHDPHDFEMVEPEYFYELDGSKVAVKSLLWYGNKTSMDSLSSVSPFISFNGDHSIISIGGNFYIFYPIGPEKEDCIPYSRDNMLRGFERCDAVIIPQVNDWWGCVKSPNRLLEAVVRGRFVLANSIPSYDVFKEWMWIGDIAEGLDWLKQQSGEEICNRIKKAQEYIKLNHSIKTVADQWETALTSVVETTTGKAS